MRCILFLPMPPSANNLYATKRGGGRTKTARYRSWIKEASLATFCAPIFTERVDVTIIARADDKRRRDADGVIKPIVDQLVRSGILKDDSREYVRRKSAEWGDVDLSRLTVPGERGVKVEIETCG